MFASAVVVADSSACSINIVGMEDVELTTGILQKMKKRRRIAKAQ